MRTNKRWTVGIFAVMAALTLASVTVSAAPPDCARWNAKITCADVGSTCDTPAKMRYYNEQLYSDTALEACKKQHKYQNPTYHGPIDIKVSDNDPDKYFCRIDNNGDGTIDSSVGDVQLEDLTPEPCCYRSPNPATAPYYNLTTTPTSGTYGGSFGSGPGSKRERIIGRNPALHQNQLMSDYKHDLWDHLVTGGLNNGYKWSAQVDHIIPRVDIQGCACGQNSVANALVISAELNGEMSNYCSHPKRVDILNKYTKP
jgi:hypothetical protein